METRQSSAVISDGKLIKPRLNITYPKVSGLSNSIVQHKINSIIMEKVYQLIREQGYVQDPSKEMTGGYEIKANRNGILSIAFDNYAYAKGAAHGLTIVKSLTIDLNTGKMYDLGDLFKPRSGYRVRISDIIKKQIKEKDIALIADFKSIDSNQDYYLTDSELVIYFQLYEYTPYAFGIPYFSIPFEALSDMVSDVGPISRLTAANEINM